MGCVFRGKGRSTWWIKYKSMGRQQYETSGSKRREDAVKLLRLREGDAAKGVPVTSQVGRLRFEEAVTDLVNYHKARNHGTKKMSRRIAMHLEPVFRKRKMADITVSDAEAYIAKRMDAGAATATINRELGLLKQMFNISVRAGKLMTKPHISLPAEHNARQGFLEYDQYLGVLKKLPTELRPVVTVAYYTGWRMKSELLKLQWSQIDRNRGRIRLEPNTTKNKDGREFFYGRIPELRLVVNGAWAEHERLKDEQRIIPFVFHRNGVQIRSMLKAFKAACKAAGVPGRIPHDLRRTAVRNLERAGVSRSAAMKLTGHKTEAVYKRYAIVSEGDLERAGEQLGLLTSVLTSEQKAQKG